MSYEVRTKDGTLKVVISNKVAKHIVDSAPGVFKSIKYVHMANGATIYELTSEGTISVGADVNLYLYPGDRLVPGV